MPTQSHNWSNNHHHKHVALSSSTTDSHLYPPANMVQTERRRSIWIVQLCSKGEVASVLRQGKTGQLGYQYMYLLKHVCGLLLWSAIYQ